MLHSICKVTEGAYGNATSQAYKDAEAYFQESLKLRLGLKESFGVKEKAQVIAQSLTSLGMLFVDIGDAEISSNSQERSHYLKALDFLLKAKKAYEQVELSYVRFVNVAS